MKKKIFFLLPVIIGIITVSCFKNREEKKTSEENRNGDYTSITENNTSQVNSDIFNLGKNSSRQQSDSGNENITNLTPEEQQNLINNKIDPVKVSQAIKDAENGNKEAILSLAHLYYGLKDFDKAKKYLQTGVNKNYPEAIYNMAMLLKEEGNMTEANKLMSRLPKDTNGQSIPGADAYNRGVNYAKAKNYREAKTQFEAAYKQGLKEADIQIALLNKQTKNYDEAVKWFKLALNRGVSAANFEIGAILFDTGRQVEARSYLIKAYNSGNKALATPIAISYHKENNMNEALKWYKIAAKNGDKDAKETVAEIEGNKTAGTGRNGINQFLNSDSQQKNDSDTSNMINSLAQNNRNNNSAVKNPVAGNPDATSVINRNARVSKAKEKNNYNVEIEEITNSRINEFGR